MRIATAWLVIGGLAAGCSTPSTPDSGVPDAGRAPEDRIFSFGLYDNAAGPPQTASVLQLKFGRGTPAADTVVARRVATPPAIDGDAADWSAISASTIPLVGPGSALGLAKAEWDGIYADAGLEAPPFDHGLASAEVKAAFDDANLYFLVTWRDPTESRLRQEWSFDGTAWNRSKRSEDRVVMAFNIGNSFSAFEAIGCTATCHIKERIGDVTPAGKDYRFSKHTSKAGESVDVWHWKASRTNPLGFADDQYVDELSRKHDGPTDFVVDNSRTLADGGAEPKYMAAAGPNANVDYIFLADAGAPAAVPFDGAGATAGARIPGSVHQRASPNKEDIRALGKWAAGTWTVELKRALTNGDPHDEQFPLR